MRKEFNTEFFLRIFFEAIILGIIVFIIQSYFNSRFQPMTAAETLRRENYLNAKRDVYYEALNLLNRDLANSSFIVNGKVTDTLNRNIGASYPTDMEINSCFSKLCIYSDNPEIPILFQNQFLAGDKTMPVLNMVTFVNLVRADMGYGKAIIDTIGDRYKFIQTHRK